MLMMNILGEWNLLSFIISKNHITFTVLSKEKKYGPNYLPFEKEIFQKYKNWKVSKNLFPKMYHLPDGELNPGLPRDRRGYSPLYYQGLSCITLVYYMGFMLPPWIIYKINVVPGGRELVASSDSHSSS